MKNCIKKLMLRSFFYLGIFQLWRFLNRNKVIILMIHGIMDSRKPSSWVPLRRQLFQKNWEIYIDTLKKYYNVISIDEAIAILSRKKTPKKYCLILTFDDGYQNQIDYALPILDKYNMPSIIYLSTNNVEKRTPFWFDRLDYVFQEIDGDRRCILIGQYEIDLNLENRESRCQSYDKLRYILKYRINNDKDMVGIINELIKRFELESGKSLVNIFENDACSKVLTWEGARKCMDGIVTFGSHAVDHNRLGHVDIKMAYDLLVNSKKTIETKLNQPCRHLCYPNGSFNQQVKEIARDIGYVSAVTDREGMNEIGDDTMSLRRMALPYNKSISEMLYIISGLHYSISLLRNRIRNLVFTCKK